MARISTVYQPCKIKKDGYTNWIDGEKFCTTDNPDGTTTPPSSGSNLIDAFDVDWSAYTIDNLSASANAIISKLNEHLKLIDGEVTSWFMEGEPTTTNAPAKDWIGTDENGIAFDYRKRHEGDTYTNINNATNEHLDNPDIWENGSSTSESGKSYDAVKTGLTTRIRTKELLRNNKSPKKIKVVAGYSVVIRYFDENKIQTTGSSDTWLSEFTLNPNYPYFALAFRKNDNSNITIDVLKSFTQSIFTVEGAFDYDPTAGQSWRWCNVDDEYGTGWYWHKIADSDAVKALTIANGVREDFDNLEIGGVNLMPNTRTGIGFTFTAVSTVCSGEFDSTNKWFKLTCPLTTLTNTQSDSILLLSPIMKLTPGKYTVSFLYRCTLPLNRIQVLYLPYLSNGRMDPRYKTLPDFRITSSDPVTYFKKYSVTFNISEELRDVYGWKIRIDLDHRGAHETNQELYIKDIKLERGDKATDWTPAPEDIEATLATKLDKITGTANNILYIGSDGNVTSSSNLKYDSTKTLLSVPKINITRTGDWANDELNPLQTQSVVIGERITGKNNLLFTTGAIQAGIKTASGYSADSLYLNPNGGVVRIGGNTQLGTNLTNGTAAISYYGEEPYKGSCVFDYKNDCFRRNTSYTTTTLGSETVKWANVYTNAINGYTINSSVPSGAVFTDTNYYPTAFSWANGTTAGPTGTLSGRGMSNVSIAAIPTATASQSGVVTTDAQTFAGIKTFNSKIKIPAGSAAGIWSGNDLLLGVSVTNDLLTGCANGDVAVGAPAKKLVLRGDDISFYDAGAQTNRLFIFEDSDKWDEYLPLAGGTMTGALCFNQPTAKICFKDKGLKIYSPERVNVNTSIGAEAFYLRSDIRLKNITSELSLDKCYDLLDKCLTIIYSLKDQTQELIGMIAQEVEEFFPEVVATDGDGFKSLAYDRLVVICLKVLKDVIKRLEKLEHE